MNRSCIAAVLVAGTFAAVFAVNGAVEVRQIFRAERFNRGDTNVSRLQEIDAAHWVWHPTAVSRGEVGKYAFLRFRKEFMANADPLTFDVSADERFVLLLDGKRIAEGPHRGSPENWLYQSYEVKLPPGSHVMEAVVWVLGPYAPSGHIVFAVSELKGAKEVRFAVRPLECFGNKGQEIYSEMTALPAS